MGDLDLKRNVAGWERALRFLVAAALLLVLPAFVRSPYGLTLGGAVAGFLLVVAFTGY